MSCSPFQHVLLKTIEKVLFNNFLSIFFNHFIGFPKFGLILDENFIQSLTKLKKSCEIRKKSIRNS